MSLASIQVMLSQLVSIGDSQNIFWRSLVQAFMDHGAGIQHLDALVKDSTQGRWLLNDFIKKVIGPVWELTETLVDLGTIDYDCPLNSFFWTFPSINIHPSLGEISGRNCWIGDKPKGPCKYKLAHFGRKVSYNEILETNSIGEYAGIRELAVYLAHLRPKQLQHYGVIAAGSVRDKTFPVGSMGRCAFELSKTPEMGWHGVRDGFEDRPEYTTEDFFLVRVYE